MTATPHPDDVREGLREAASRRADAIRATSDAVIDIADWAIRGRQADMQMTELAKLAGVSRVQLYKLIDWRQGKKPTRA